ncbi:Imidazole glycerol phosphate synthase subunit HisF [Buchnera aphidicola (Periphyllus testudinaceus)]|uniref:imidazole glycerol phosphate synthase subunit HisF n=1 Tax=Buchnera aphidicola TaxID=9 RepID=UPI0034640D13
MLSKRIITCLDVKNGFVINGITFEDYKIVGNILSLVKKYIQDGSDELFFYDYLSLIQKKNINTYWISRISEIINIPLCFSGRIKNFKEVKDVLNNGAHKISINFNSIENPYLISDIADKFGIQSVVVSINSYYSIKKKKYFIYQYNKNKNFFKKKNIETYKWIEYIQKLGAGEIILNSINKNNKLNNEYDIKQLRSIRKICKIPLITFGNPNSINNFYDVFRFSDIDGVIISSIFHENIVSIKNLKDFLFIKNIDVRR